MSVTFNSGINSGKDNLMNFKQKFAFAALGSIFTIVGMLFSPFQKNRFGEIECTKLRIVNEDGKNRVVLATRETGGGRVSVYDEDGKKAISLGVLESGGYVGIFHRDKLLARLSVLENGGAVGVNGKDGKNLVSLGINKHGGIVSVRGGDGESWVVLSIDEHGGIVGVKSKDGNSKAFTP